MDRSSEAIQLSSQVEDNEEQAKIKILKSDNLWKDFLIKTLRQENESLRQEKYLFIERS